jgi:hypothetical protein
VTKAEWRDTQYSIFDSGKETASGFVSSTDLISAAR